MLRLVESHLQDGSIVGLPTLSVNPKKYGLENSVGVRRHDCIAPAAASAGTRETYTVTYENCPGRILSRLIPRLWRGSEAAEGKALVRVVDVSVVEPKGTGIKVRPLAGDGGRQRAAIPTPGAGQSASSTRRFWNGPRVARGCISPSELRASARAGEVAEWLKAAVCQGPQPFSFLLLRSLN